MLLLSCRVPYINEPIVLAKAKVEPLAGWPQQWSQDHRNSVTDRKWLC